MAQVNQYVVRGYKKIEYIKRSTGQQVSGTEVYLDAVERDDDVTGDQFVVVYLSNKTATYIPVLGDCVRILYNQYGKIDDLNVI